MMSIVIGPKWPFLLMYMYSDVDVGTGGSWVELPVQRRLCPIFVNSVRSPDIHKFPRVDGLSIGPPGIGASQLGIRA